jgi:hypothetical protein
MTLDTAHLRGGGDSPNVQGMVGPRGGRGVVQSPTFTSYTAYPGLKVENSVTRGRAASLGQYFGHGSTVVYTPPFFMPCQDDPRKKPLVYKSAFFF